MPFGILDFAVSGLSGSGVHPNAVSSLERPSRKERCATKFPATKSSCSPVLKILHSEIGLLKGPGGALVTPSGI